MITADTQLAVRHAALRLSANDFLTKPVNFAELNARAGNLLALRRGQLQLADRAAWLVAEVSKATLGIVAGWTLLQQGLEREGLEARIVVQKSECEFLQPVAAEFFAESRLPAEEWPRFLATLRKRGRARITVHSTLRSAGQEVVRHSGTFVALAGEPT